MSSCRRARQRTTWRCRPGCAPVHVAQSAAPVYPSWVCAGQLPRLRWDDPAVQTFLSEGRPVVLTGGCPFSAGIVGRWTLDYLAASDCRLGGNAAHIAPRAVRRFSRFYGKGLGKGAVLNMSAGEFVQTAVANEAREAPPWRYYMQSVMVWSRSSKGGAYNATAGGRLDTPCGELLHPDFGKDSEGGASPLFEDVRGRLDWEWLARALDTAQSTGIHSCTVWMGMGGGATPMHFDAMSNFFTQLVGRKRVLVFPPSQAYNIYPHACEHVQDSYSMVDLEALGATASSGEAGGGAGAGDVAGGCGEYPALARARGLEATLEAGDVLWLPSFYWHHVRRQGVHASDPLPHLV